MEEKRTYPRFTITLEPSVAAKLPKRDKSALINEILKQHFQREGAEQLYAFTRNKLMKDEEFAQYLEVTIKETMRYA